MVRSARTALELVLLVAWALAGCARERTGEVRPIEGPMDAWLDLGGSLEARHTHNVMCTAGGSAVLSELAPDGARVERDAVVARLDSAQWEREAARLERDLVQASVDLHSLTNARARLELIDLEQRLADARRQEAEDAQALLDDRELQVAGLISEQEVRRSELRAQASEAAARGFATQLELTRDYLHPAALARAEATVRAAAQELAMVRTNLANCVMRAPAAGQAIHRPLGLGGEFRTARVGDTVYRNQPFLVISDMREPIVRCQVPEQDLARVPAGAAAIVTPLAYPTLCLTGCVESVGASARAAAGGGGDARHFEVVLRLEQTDERLRPGMTVRTRVQSFRAERVLQLPRAAIRWDAAGPYCDVQRGGRRERRRLTIGRANDRTFEILGGLRAEDRVVLP